jgi:molybdenum cofactor cytidylyltransferase
MDLNQIGKLNLARGLRLQSKDPHQSPRDLRVAFVGAGGKSTALFLLARQLPPPVLVSASTHLSSSQLALADRHFTIRKSEELAALKSQLLEGVILLTGPIGEDERTVGLDEAILVQLLHLAASTSAPLLVEADGSRRLPLKAPADHEPAIPLFSNRVVVVAGMSGLGRRLEEGSIHRPERFADLSGLRMGELVGEDALLRVLFHPLGGLKGIPKGAISSVLLNQADRPEQVEAGRRMAEKLLAEYNSVLVASLDEPASVIHSVHEKTAAVVLAAGGSSRLGVPKQLLEWQGVPFVRHIVRTALSAGLDPVVVVTGAYAQEVEDALHGMEVKLAYNPAWQQGQSSSIKAGVRALPPEVGSTIFLLSDQPQVGEKLLQELTQGHASSLAHIVAPRVHGRRANPVLFDIDTFSELLQLQGDTGGRSLFKERERFPVHWIDWDDANLLLDVDTPEDYQRLLNLELKT